MRWAGKEPEDRKEAIERALRCLEEERGKETADNVRPIIYTNDERGRIANHLKDASHNSIQTYVRHIADGYEAQSSYLRRLQTDQDPALWPALYEQLQTWAYHTLIGYKFYHGQETHNRAVDIAADAACAIVNSHFPYDTEFDAWATIIVRNVCKKHIDQSKKQWDKIEKHLSDLGEFLPQMKDARTKSVDDKIQISHDLLDAISELTEARCQVIVSYYIDGDTFAEIAVAMDRSVAAVYQLHFKALDQLRKILGSKGYNL